MNCKLVIIIDICYLLAASCVATIFLAIVCCPKYHILENALKACLPRTEPPFINLAPNASFSWVITRNMVMSLVN